MKLPDIRLRAGFKFFLERQFVKGAQFQLLFVAALIGFISLVGGLLVLPVDGADRSLSEAVWWAFLRLSDPGYLGDDEGLWRRFVSTILTVLGYVVFWGSMVAIITSWLNRKIRNLEQGLTPVTSKNHVLILGWTSKTIYTAGEIYQSVGRLRRFLKFYGAAKLKLIILAEDVTPDHVQELRDNPLIGSGADNIILRSGISIDREHLRRVDSLNASAIIIPGSSQTERELITPDVETIKTLLSINAEAENVKVTGRMPYVVAEIQDENKITAAYRAYSGPLEVIGSNTIISRLLAQNIRHSGLSVVYNALLTHSFGNNIFSRHYPEASGKYIEDLIPAFPNAIILGIVKQNQESFSPFLNVPGNFKVQADDRLVLLAESSADIEMKNLESSTRQKIISTQHDLQIEQSEGIVKILIIGWNHHIPALIKELCTYEDEYYHITLVSIYPAEQREKELERLQDLSNRVQWEHVQTDFVKEAALQKLNPSTFDQILLVSSERLLEKEEADARTIVGYVLLEEVLENSPTKPNILLELSDPDNESLLRKYNSEVIITPLILSNLLAGIALQREVNSIYKELFTVGGAEIIFKTYEEYKMKPGTYTFAELEKKAAQYGETALGIFRPNELKKSDDALVLNPIREKKLEINSSTRLVILTTVY